MLRLDESQRCRIRADRAAALPVRGRQMGIGGQLFWQKNAVERLCAGKKIDVQPRIKTEFLATT